MISSPPLKCEKRGYHSFISSTATVCEDCGIHPTTEPKITSTGGETVYVEAPPFHKPAHAISQSVSSILEHTAPVEGEWETIGEPALNHLADIIIDDKSDREQRIRKIKNAITTLLHREREKGRAEERERIVKMCEEMKRKRGTDDYVMSDQNSWYNQALSDLRDKLSTL